jgi:hypothetical protein
VMYRASTMAYIPHPCVVQVSVLSLFLLRSVVVYAMNAAIIAAGMPQRARPLEQQTPR